MSKDSLTTVVETVGLALVCVAAWLHGADVGFLVTGIVLTLYGYLIARRDR